MVGVIFLQVIENLSLDFIKENATMAPKVPEGQLPISLEATVMNQFLIWCNLQLNGT